MNRLVHLTVLTVLGAAAHAGQVAGTVVSAQGGEPLASVELTLSPIQADGDQRRDRGPLERLANQGPSARTALDGRFVFPNVAPGEYMLGAGKAGYEGGGRVARRVSLSDSEPSASLSIELKRSPSLEGRVVDADGDPLANVRIELRAWTMTESQRMLRGIRGAQTDDRGEYRVSNLTPGAYYVYLHPATLTMRQGGVLYESAGGYYPQGASPAEAAKIELDWGMDLKGVDMTAAAPGGTLASGVVLREDGAPCPECSIVILDSEGLSAASTRLADSGRFAIHGLTAAEYSFLARGPRGAGSAVEKVYLPDRRPVELSLRLSPGQPVSGFLSLEKAEDGQTPELQGATFRLLPADMTLGGQPGGARIESDGTFEVQQAPQGLYRPLVFGLPANGYISRILYGGAALPDGLLRVTADGPVSGVELVARFDGGAVHGQAVDADGESPAPPDGIAVLLPQRTEAASDFPVMRGYRGDALEFQFDGVAPGKYLLFSIPRSFAWDWSDPALLAELRRRAKPIEVKPGETVEAVAPFLQGP